MARKNETALTIAALERILRSQRQRLNTLETQRNKLRKKIEQIDRDIASLSGEAAGTASRAHNTMSLVATLESVLQRAGKALPVGEILAQVKKAGYRSTSANFRALVNAAFTSGAVTSLCLISWNAPLPSWLFGACPESSSTGASAIAAV